MTSPCHDVGVLVLGALHAPRVLVRHAGLFAAYADGVMWERGEDREAYLSHFAYGEDMRTYYAAHGHSVKGFVGTNWCRRMFLDIDRTDAAGNPDVATAIADARRLVTRLHARYPETEGRVPVWFSGKKGFTVGVELAHGPPPSVIFHRVCRALAVGISAEAGVKIDTSIYDAAHVIRLPNTRHPGTGLYKRLLDADALFALDADGVRRHAEHPAGDGVPTLTTVPAQLVTDWCDAARVAVTADPMSVARSRASHTGVPDERAPRDILELLRFGVGEGERHKTLFRCAAWLTGQGAPPSLCFALLTEPGRDVGLTPRDVERQIRCGIDHAQRQRANQGEGGPPA